MVVNSLQFAFGTIVSRNDIKSDEIATNMQTASLSVSGGNG